MEIDYPSNYANNKLPILDIKVWTERQEAQDNILFELYNKDVATKAVINAKSAISWQTKRTVLTQEALRILLNCSDTLPREVVNKHLEHLIMKLQFSGYDKRFRYDIINSAYKAYNTRREEETAGIRPMHRPREWQNVKRQRDKKEKKRNWYKKDGAKSVIFVPATPYSKLKREYEHEIKNSEHNIMIVEHAGRSLKTILQNQIH